MEVVYHRCGMHVRTRQHKGNLGNPSAIAYRYFCCVMKLADAR